MPFMGNVLGIIFSNMHDKTIEDLTKLRTMGSVLFGGRYRLIDFPLSNMVNSGITEVGVITKSNFQSLLDHLGSGREWDLSRKKGGLHILPPFSNTASGMYRGRLEALAGVLGFISHSPAEYVLMADCDVVTNMDFRPVLEAHESKGADITIVCNKNIYNMEQTRFGTVLAMNEDNRVYDVLINPQISGMCTMSLNMFVVKKDFLIQMVQQAYTRSQYSFVRDILQAKVNDLKIYGYECQDYLSKIDSMDSYYKANMALLDNDTRDVLFPLNRPIYTKVRDNAPCKYGIGAKVSNSLIADGCTIEGEVENCVLFRGVKISKGARVRNSIIMQGSVVGKKCDINYIIADKNVGISDFRTLSGSELYPMYVGKGAIL